MFTQIFLYEIRYRLKRPATWIFFMLLFLMTFFAVTTDNITIGGHIGNIFRNAPFVIANTLAVISAFAITITTAIMSTPVHRDFETNAHTIFFTLPLNKWQYLDGRFFGALTINFLVFFGIPFGILIGSAIAPIFGWIEPDRFGAFNFWHYLHPYLFIVIPNVLFSGAIFFGLATLTRKILYAYMGNIILLVTYIITLNSITDVENIKWASIFDPFAIITIDEITR